MLIAVDASLVSVADGSVRGRLEEVRGHRVPLLLFRGVVLCRVVSCPSQRRECVGYPFIGRVIRGVGLRYMTWKRGNVVFLRVR